MLKFNNVHLYRNQANNLDFNVIVTELQKYFPKISIDVRHPFLEKMDIELAESLVYIRITDIKKQFNEQLRTNSQEILNKNIAYEMNFSKKIIFNGINNSITTEGQYKELILYDGFMMQRLLGTMINESESNTDHIHIVFEDRLL